MVNMSRMAEELVLWTTREFAFVWMADAYSTGSSIMPQKRNPDAAELVRGKSGRVIGDLSTLLTLVKGLPMAYNRDLQEDREALFDALETTTSCARICGGMYATLTVKAQRYENELRHDFLLATEIADYLASKGVPFRDAHHVSGVVDAVGRGPFRCLMSSGPFLPDHRQEVGSTSLANSNNIATELYF